MFKILKTVVGGVLVYVGTIGLMVCACAVLDNGSAQSGE